MLAPRWVAAILALGGLEAVTSYALMAPTAPHVGAFREGSDLLAPEEGSFATILPSLDDFRARDRAAAESTAPVAEPAPTLPQRQQPEPQQQQLPSPEAFSQPASFAPSAPSAPATPQELLQERFFELLSFDTIDDRPVNEEPYDLTARLIGRGLPNKAGVYLLPYLQSGHMLLLGVLLLSSLVSYPGFPLTTVPSEYRGLLLQGLGINYVINAVCAVYARGIAASKEEPVTFWMVKCFLFGGLALGELTEAVPMPTKPKNGRGAGM